MSEHRTELSNESPVAVSVHPRVTRPRLLTRIRSLAPCKHQSPFKSQYGKFGYRIRHLHNVTPLRMITGSPRELNSELTRLQVSPVGPSRFLRNLISTPSNPL